MTLIPNQPFADGDIYTPEVAYLAFNQVYDDQPQYLGHHERIKDNELSDLPGMVKDRLRLITDDLKVVPANGLNCTVNQGVVGIDNSIISIPSQSITIPNNSTVTVFVDSSGVVSVGNSTQIGVYRLPLATVTSISGSISQVIDLRTYRQILPIRSSIKTFGGASNTDYTAPAGSTTFAAGVYYFRNFTVPVGATINVSQYTEIKCSGTVVVAGTINCTNLANGAYAPGTGITNSSMAISIPGSGIGGNGNSYSYVLQPFGSGGSSGYAWTTQTASQYVVPGQGGHGGGSLSIEAAGSITISGTITANGTKGVQGSTQGITFVNGQPTYTPGSGSSNANCSGGGGGSGGFIGLASLVSVTLTASSTLEVIGGEGGDAFTFPANNGANPAIGGYGGSGGFILLMAPITNTNGITRFNGGLSGLPAGQGITQVNSTTYTTAVAGGFWGSGFGGGFGGNGNSSTLITGSGNTYTRLASQSGQVVTRNFVPIG